MKDINLWQSHGQARDVEPAVYLTAFDPYLDNQLIYHIQIPLIIYFSTFHHHNLEHYVVYVTQYDYVVSNVYCCSRRYKLLELLGFSPHPRLHHRIHMSKLKCAVFLQEPRLYMDESIQHGLQFLICMYHATGDLSREVANTKYGIRGMLPVTTIVTLEVKHQPSHSYGTSLGGVTVTIDKLLDMQRQTHGRY